MESSEWASLTACLHVFSSHSIRCINAWYSNDVLPSVLWWTSKMSHSATMMSSFKADLWYKPTTILDDLHSRNPLHQQHSPSHLICKDHWAFSNYQYRTNHKVHMDFNCSYQLFNVVLLTYELSECAGLTTTVALQSFHLEPQVELSIHLKLPICPQLKKGADISSHTTYPTCIVHLPREPLNNWRTHRQGKNWPAPLNHKSNGHV